MPDNGFEKLKVDHHQVSVGKVQAWQTDLYVARDGCLKGVWAVRSGQGAAAISQSYLAGKGTVNRKALGSVVEDEPSGMMVHLSTHKDQSVGHLFKGNVHRRKTR